MKSGACSIEWSLCRPFVLLSLTSTLPNLFPESARGREVLLHLPRTERPRRDRVVGERTSAGSVPSRSALTPALPARAPQARLHPVIQVPPTHPATPLYYSRRAPREAPRGFDGHRGPGPGPLTASPAPYGPPPKSGTSQGMEPSTGSRPGDGSAQGAADATHCTPTATRTNHMAVSPSTWRNTKCRTRHERSKRCIRLGRCEMVHLGWGGKRVERHRGRETGAAELINHEHDQRDGEQRREGVHLEVDGRAA